MIWLGIDTSNTPLAIAIVRDGQVLAEYKSSLKITHSIGTMPAIEELLKKRILSRMSWMQLQLQTGLVLTQVCELA